MTPAGRDGFSQEHSPDPGHEVPVIDTSIIVWLIEDTAKRLRARFRRPDRTTISRALLNYSTGFYQLFRSTPF